MSYIGSNQYERQRPSNSFYNSSSLNRSYIQTTVPHRNPRQQEIWELQSNHQNRLNYIHFKARLEGKELPEGDNQPDFKIPTFANELYSLQLKERELIETLRQEKRLLEEARLNTTTEIDKCKRMLEEFRAQRRRKLSEKQADNEARRKTYERELESLRQTIANEKTDIKVSIHQVEYAGDDDDNVSLLNRSKDLRDIMLRNQEQQSQTQSPNITTKTYSSIKQTTTSKKTVTGSSQD